MKIESAGLVNLLQSFATWDKLERLFFVFYFIFCSFISFMNKVRGVHVFYLTYVYVSRFIFIAINIAE